MADENLLDLQQIQCAIPPGSNGTRITVTHNLQDTDGNPIAPDTVIVEVVSYPEEDPDNPCNLVGQHRIPSSPEDGTYELEIRAADANAGAQDWDIVVQITSMYEHSIQSDDHIPELTVQAGTPIIDCPQEEPFEVWAGGSVAYSSDSGSSWGDIFVGLPAPWTGQEASFESYDVVSPAAGTVWTCGIYLTETGFAGYWDGVVWALFDGSGTRPTLDIFVNPQIGCHGFGPTDAWSVGVGPICAQYNGVLWTDHSVGCALAVGNAVWGVSSADLWVGGDAAGSAAVSHWNGAAWDVAAAPLPNGAGYTVRSIWGTDSNNVWAVGGDNTGNGKIWYWNGAVWADITPVEVTQECRVIHGLAANNFWVGGDTGMLLRYTGSWNTIVDPVLANVNILGFFAYADNNLWACESGTQKIFYYNGVAWVDVAHGVVSPNFSAWWKISGVWY